VQLAEELNEYLTQYQQLRSISFAHCLDSNMSNDDSNNKDIGHGFVVGVCGGGLSLLLPQVCYSTLRNFEFEFFPSVLSPCTFTLFQTHSLITP
jgi:hypothetical protein